MTLPNWKRYGSGMKSNQKQSNSGGGFFRSTDLAETKGILAMIRVSTSHLR